MSSNVIRHDNIIPLVTRQSIASRYHTVTKAINQEFWNSTSETTHSLYVGSYGRNTAINTSDIDILVEIPEDEYNRYSYSKWNGQSRLLQAVKNAIETSYSRSDIRADGQVVKIAFSDGMKFEVLPAFPQASLGGSVSYKYPDTNMGGNWRTTDPKSEQKAMKEKNSSSNGLLCATCKHIRTIRDDSYSSYHLSGILIDSFVYVAMGEWHFTDGDSNSSSQPISYEQALLNYYNHIPCNGISAPSLYAPGSGMSIDTTKGWDVLGKILNKMVSE